MSEATSTPAPASAPAPIHPEPQVEATQETLSPAPTFSGGIDSNPTATSASSAAVASSLPESEATAPTVLTKEPEASATESTTSTQAEAEIPIPTSLATEESAPNPVQEATSASLALAEATPAPTATKQPPAEATAETIPEMISTKVEPTQEVVAPTAAATQVAAAVQEEKSTPVENSAGEADTDIEPQNALTEKFTQAEWTALKELRAQLPEILAEAFPDKAEAKSTAICIWGVSIDPAKPKDARVSVVLIKFLRARNLNPRSAREMLVSTLRWRESFNIEAALKEEFPQHLFGNMGYISGKDKAGRPVVYNLYGANPDFKAVFADVQQFVRWRVALQERSVDFLDFTEVDQMIQVHDYDGVSLSSRDANSKAAAAEATNIFQSHYPEMLYKKFFINVPTLLNWIFWAFKSFIPSATLAKMSLVGTGRHSIKKALLPYIEADNLPKRYGGTAEAF